MALPLIVSADLLATELATIAPASSATLRLIDLRPPEHYQTGHIEGATQIDAARLSKSEAPVGGLLPDAEQVNSLLREAGVNSGDHVVAIDSGGATLAARLIWVLHAYGLDSVSWLDGGMAAWINDGHPVTVSPSQIRPGNITLSLDGNNVIDPDTLLARLDNKSPCVLDTRSLAEYRGEDVRSAFGGHVPGALHADWVDLLTPDGRLKPLPELEGYFQNLAVKPTTDTVVYCQTHQRSSMTYLALKALGYPSVMGLDGAWSNWGNRADLPREI